MCKMTVPLVCRLSAHSLPTTRTSVAAGTSRPRSGRPAPRGGAACARACPAHSLARLEQALITLSFLILYIYIYETRLCTSWVLAGALKRVSFLSLLSSISLRPLFFFSLTHSCFHLHLHLYSLVARLSLPHIRPSPSPHSIPFLQRPYMYIKHYII
jgi:hypothetical protein